MSISPPEYIPAPLYRGIEEFTPMRPYKERLIFKLRKNAFSNVSDHAPKTQYHIPIPYTRELVYLVKGTLIDARCALRSTAYIYTGDRERTTSFQNEVPSNGPYYGSPESVFNGVQSTWGGEIQHPDNKRRLHRDGRRLHARQIKLKRGSMRIGKQRAVASRRTGEQK